MLSNLQAPTTWPTTHRYQTSLQLQTNKNFRCGNRKGLRLGRNDQTQHRMGPKTMDSTPPSNRKYLSIHPTTETANSAHEAVAVAVCGRMWPCVAVSVGTAISQVVLMWWIYQISCSRQVNIWICLIRSRRQMFLVIRLLRNWLKSR